MSLVVDIRQTYGGYSGLRVCCGMLKGMGGFRVTSWNESGNREQDCPCEDPNPPHLFQWLVLIFCWRLEPFLCIISLANIQGAFHAQVVSVV